MPQALFYPWVTSRPRIGWPSPHALMPSSTDEFRGVWTGPGGTGANTKRSVRVIECLDILSRDCSPALPSNVSESHEIPD